MKRKHFTTHTHTRTHARTHDPFVLQDVYEERSQTD